MYPNLTETAHPIPKILVLVHPLIVVASYIRRQETVNESGDEAVELVLHFAGKVRQYACSKDHELGSVHEQEHCLPWGMVTFPDNGDMDLVGENGA